MLKRKRGEADGAYSFSLTQSNGLEQQKRQLRNHFEHGVKVLHDALKLAKGFESQKLGRRRKTAQSKNDQADLARLKAEYQTLKVRAIGLATGFLHGRYTDCA